MAWIRLSDDYINDEKIFGLSDGSFRLWHEGMAYCRRYQTDGLIPFVVMRGLRSFTKNREKQLATPAREGIAPLWILVPGVGYRVHKYLDWNLSKEEESNERSASAARQRKFRGVRNGVTNGVTEGVTNGDVLDRSRRGKELGSRSESKWPIYKGNRLVVFDWMLAEMQRTLGPHAGAMEWDVWLDATDQRARQKPEILKDWWPWLQAELLAHARQRGWTVGEAPATEDGGEAKYHADTQAAADRLRELLRRDGTIA